MASPEKSSTICSICHDNIDDQDAVLLTSKGCESVNKASEVRNSNVHVKQGDHVHTPCRKAFTNSKDINTFLKCNLLEGTCSTNTTPEPKVLRSQQLFEFKTQCIFCGVSAKKSGLK